VNITPMQRYHLLRHDDGTDVTGPADWATRRAVLLERIQSIEYGHVPPAPDDVQFHCIIGHDPRHLSPAQHRQYQISTSGLMFTFDLFLPNPSDPAPVIVCGDACWHPIDETILRLALSRGVAVASFNRCEVSPDNAALNRTTGLHRTIPGDYGAVAAWAWAYQRVVDVLVKLDDVIDASRIILTGHSRGGKAALLAGATDTRVALVNPNGSGCCGAGSFRVRGEKSERLGDILRFTHWFSPALSAYAGREDELPFDQDALVAAVAPRAVLLTEASDDHWANPTGTTATFTSARDVYRLLGVADKIAIHFRPGRHDHALPDWTALLDSGAPLRSA